MTDQTKGQGLFPRSRTFGTVASTARLHFNRMFSRESMFRLLLSLVLALALWVFVTGRNDPTTFGFGQALPISTANVPPALVVANSLGTVHVRIRVDNRNAFVSASDFHTFVNAQNLGPGAHHVPVVVVTNPGIHVAAIRPSHVTVVLEKRMTKHVPVRYHILDTPPSGYQAGDVSAQPSTATVSGPSSIVSQVAQASVYLYLAQARSSVEGSYRLSLTNSQGQGITGSSRLVVNPPQVQVFVPIHAVSSYKTVPILAQIQGHAGSGFGVSSVTVDPAEITAHGQPTKLGKVRVIDTAPISLSHHGPGTIHAEVNLQFPSGVSSPTRRVKVSVRVGSVSGSSSIPIGISPVNVGAGLQLKIHPATVLVTMVGPASRLDVIGRRVQATINLSGLGPGTYRLAPIIQPPPAFRVAGVYPAQVRVEVSAG
ncbi:MAG: CdaR family protein [Chloroflexota bacterium]